MKKLNNKIFGNNDSLKLLENTDDLHKIISPLNKNTEYLYLLFNVLFSGDLIEHMLTTDVNITFNGFPYSIKLNKKELNNEYKVLYMLYKDEDFIGVYDEKLIPTEKYLTGIIINDFKDNINYNFNFATNNYKLRILIFEINFDLSKLDKLDVNHFTEEELNLLTEVKASIVKDNFIDDLDLFKDDTNILSIIKLIGLLSNNTKSYRRNILVLNRKPNDNDGKDGDLCFVLYD